MAARRGPGLATPGAPQVIRDDNHHQFTECRPVREIRDELIEVGREAYEAGRVVDPDRVDRLATELDWAAALAVMFGGDAQATARFAAACRETSELARLTRRAVSV